MQNDILFWKVSALVHNCKRVSLYYVFTYLCKHQIDAKRTTTLENSKTSSWAFIYTILMSERMFNSCQYIVYICYIWFCAYYLVLCLHTILHTYLHKWLKKIRANISDNVFDISARSCKWSVLRHMGVQPVQGYVTDACECIRMHTDSHGCIPSTRYSRVANDGSHGYVLKLPKGTAY